MIKIKSLVTWIVVGTGVSVATVKMLPPSATEAPAVRVAGTSRNEPRAALNNAVLENIAPENQEDNGDPDAVIDYDAGDLTAILVTSSQDKAEKWKTAIELMRNAASENNREFLNEISKLPADCASCQGFFYKARSLMNSPDYSYDEKAYVARALAASGKAENQSFLIQQMNQAASLVSQKDELTGAELNPALQDENSLTPTTIANALDDQKIVPEVIDELDASLNSKNRFVRDAAISMLTQQGTLDSIKKLYEFTVEQNDPVGFYNDGMGIGRVKPGEDALPFLEELVKKQDAYSNLALKAMLNEGEAGRAKALALLASASGDTYSQKALVKDAVDHWPLKGPEYTKIQGMTNSDNVAIKQLATQVVAEHNSQEYEKNKKFELNEYSDLGLVDEAKNTPPGT